MLEIFCVQYPKYLNKCILLIRQWACFEGLDFCDGSFSCYWVTVHAIYLSSPSLRRMCQNLCRCSHHKGIVSDDSSKMGPEFFNRSINVDRSVPLSLAYQFFFLRSLAGLRWSVLMRKYVLCWQCNIGTRFGVASTGDRRIICTVILGANVRLLLGMRQSSNLSIEIVSLDLEISHIFMRKCCMHIGRSVTDWK